MYSNAKCAVTAGEVNVVYYMDNGQVALYYVNLMASEPQWPKIH